MLLLLFSFLQCTICTAIRSTNTKRKPLQLLACFTIMKHEKNDTGYGECFVYTVRRVHVCRENPWIEWKNLLTKCFPRDLKIGCVLVCGKIIYLCNFFQVHENRMYFVLTIRRFIFKVAHSVSESLIDFLPKAKSKNASSTEIKKSFANMNSTRQSALVKKNIV